MRRKEENGASARLAPVLVALVAAGVCAVLYADVLVPASGLGWDESSHAAYGLRQARHLRLGEVVEFVRENARLGAWPFVHSWMLAIAYLLAGATVVTARSVSLVCFFLFVLVLYRVAAEVAPRVGRLAGSIAVALALTSPMLLLFACKAMLELPALLLGWSALLAYLRARRTGDTRTPWLAAVLAVLTFFTRYDYGLYVMGTLLLMEAVEVLRAIRSGATGEEKRRRAAGPVLDIVLLGLMFATTWAFWTYCHPGFGRYARGTWHSHFYTPVAQPRLPLNLTWLTYYPISIARDYTASMALAALLLVGSVAALARLRDRGRLLCVVLFCVGVPLVFFHVPLEPGGVWFPFLEHARFQMMIVPALWVLASAQLAEWCTTLAGRGGVAGRVAIGAALVAVLAGGARNVYGAIARGEYAPRVGEPEPRECLDRLGRVIASSGGDVRVYVVDDVSRVAPGVVEWELRTRAPDEAEVDVLWPVWPDDPRGGHEARLRALLRSARANWVITTETPSAETEGGGRRRYIRAVEALPNARLMGECRREGSFAMKIYSLEVAP